MVIHKLHRNIVYVCILLCTRLPTTSYNFEDLVTPPAISSPSPTILFDEGPCGMIYYNIILKRHHRRQHVADIIVIIIIIIPKRFIYCSADRYHP